jgi:hypothetical protein
METLWKLRTLWSMKYCDRGTCRAFGGIAHQAQRELAYAGRQARG